jgi:hypothetical protein
MSFRRKQSARASVQDASVLERPGKFNAASAVGPNAAHAFELLVHSSTRRLLALLNPDRAMSPRPPTCNDLLVAIMLVCHERDDSESPSQVRPALALQLAPWSTLTE